MGIDVLVAFAVRENEVSSTPRRRSRRAGCAYSTNPSTSVCAVDATVSCSVSRPSWSVDTSPTEPGTAG
jgi:hypothetical protein